MNTPRKTCIEPKPEHLSPDDNFYRQWERIPENQLRDGFTYELRARNASIGIYMESCRGFYVPRLKFGQRFIDFEYDYATGPPFGTAVPKRELEVYDFQKEPSMLRYLRDWEERQIKLKS